MTKKYYQSETINIMGKTIYLYKENENGFYFTNEGYGYMIGLGEKREKSVCDKLLNESNFYLNFPLIYPALV